jgi:hypothetical protein
MKPAVQRAIERAIEGGWQAGKQVRIQTYLMGKLPTVSVGEPSDLEEFLRAQNYLLDPLFWQALERNIILSTDGWEKFTPKRIEEIVANEANKLMHAMVDDLIEGKTPEQFLQTLFND